MLNKKSDKINLLIISYHYPPLPVIASNRPSGFAEHLFKFGVYPTIVTHRWELGDNQKWIVHKRNDEVQIFEDRKHRVIRIPRYRTFWGNVYRHFEKFYGLRQIMIIFRWMRGSLDPVSDSIDSYMAFRIYLFQHLKNNSYDIIMGIFSPHHHLKLCYEVNNKFGTPYLLDFRDLWDNRATDPSYKPSASNKLYVKQIKKCWSKWLSKAKFFTTLSQPWIRKINELTSTTGHIVMHGYDDDIVKIQNIDPDKDEFIVLYVGSLYQNQDLVSFLEGVKEFIGNIRPENFKLVFLGSDRSVKKSRGGFYNNVSDTLSNYLPQDKFILEARLPRQDVLEWYRRSSVLLHISYEREFGTFGGKFFEYVGTGRPILVHSNGNCIIADTVKKNGFGYVADSQKRIVEILKMEYFNWKNGASSDFFKYDIKSENYSREFQSFVLSQLLNNDKKNKK